MERQTAQQHGHVAVNAVEASLFNAHSTQRQIELLGHQHRQRGVNALAHFTSGHGHHHAAVGGDLDPAIEGHFARRHRQQGSRPQARTLRHHAPAHHQGTGRAQGAQNPGSSFHAALPWDRDERDSLAVFTVLLLMAVATLVAVGAGAAGAPAISVAAR